MTRERYLIDKSAMARWGKPAVRPILDDLSQRALLAVSAAVEMEVLHSARNAAEADRLSHLLRGFDYLPCTDEVWDRAKDIQRRALFRGNHRALSMADVLIAATAERHGVTVLHYDGDYDMIAAITGQSTRWVVPAGAAD
ncbi:twitching motility protein PilT [Streptomyces rubellomurinus subsp. indigoferus]|uniref:Ribonuclease VapC n=2 Tax=Streptomyces rubellomurinus (strain ATCC 31215) TaxID=359131 RepID=A0A0F2TJZ9_STRR3|nr:twitching motility protein PilT [Streptomyces rubellomurinus subsp. indigoferus]KJS63459.1 twitching motility protein PilT [Streptomyces rubellomurinus]